MDGMVAGFLEGLLEPVLALGDPAKRIYYGSLMGALLVMLAFYRRNFPEKVKNLLFNRQLWFHPSSMLDFRIVMVNGFLRVLAIAPMLATVTGVGATVYVTCTEVFGAITPVQWPPLAIMALFTAVAFLAEDFSRFFLHYLQHKLPFLWEFHKVHHSAEVLTPLTLYRTHPVEIFCAGMRHGLVMGLVTGVFFYAFRGQISGFDILGVDAAGFLFNFLGANLRHSHVPISYGP